MRMPKMSKTMRTTDEIADFEPARPCGQPNAYHCWRAFSDRSPV